LLCTFRQAQDLPGPATFHLLLFFAPVRRLLALLAAGRPARPCCTACLMGLVKRGCVWLSGACRAGAARAPIRTL